jgi:hypothetical protein
MATNDLIVRIGTPIVIANSTYSPGTNTTLGTRTDDIDTAGITTGAARQGVKFDFGANRATSYSVRATMELATDPAAGGTIDYYISPSHSATAAVGNTGGASGADAAYTGYSGHTLAESLKHLDFVGSIPAGVQNDSDGVIIAVVGTFVPTARYACLIIVNNTSVSFHSDSIEMATLFEPQILQRASS